jgi:hypothetical protein
LSSQDEDLLSVAPAPTNQRASVAPPLPKKDQQLPPSLPPKDQGYSSSTSGRSNFPQNEFISSMNTPIDMV